MSALWTVVGSALGFVVLAAAGDLVSEEVGTRLDQLPRALLRVAVRVLPREHRMLRLAEAEGELYEILRGAHALPVTRLCRGLKYAAGWLWASCVMVRQEAAVRRAARKRGPLDLLVTPVLSHGIDIEQYAMMTARRELELALRMRLASAGVQDFGVWGLRTLGQLAQNRGLIDESYAREIDILAEAANVSVHGSGGLTKESALRLHARAMTLSRAIRA